MESLLCHSVSHICHRNSRIEVDAVKNTWLAYSELSRLHSFLKRIMAIPALRCVLRERPSRTMLAEKRHSIIIDEISRQPAVSIKHLTKLLGVSRETVRKDIELLSQRRKLHQVRGGAVPVLTTEPPIADRVLTNPKGKALIADMVVERIGDGASVIIDSGSTTLVAAQKLVAARKNLTVYTNDLQVAFTIGSSVRELIVLGGRLDPRDNTIFGLEAIEHLKHYHAEFALVGIGGLNEKKLFTDFSRESATLRQLMMRHAETAMVLSDSSKFGAVSRVNLSLTENAVVLSDCAPDDNIRLALSKAGHRMICAN